MRIFITIFFISVFSIKGMLASCVVDLVSIFPRAGKLASNSLFLIEFNSLIYDYKKIAQEASFVAINQNGKKFKLKILQINFSGTQGQFLLQPIKNFKVGDSISLRINWSLAKDSLKMFESLIKNYFFKTQIQNRKWKVILEEDHQQPHWESDSVKYSFLDFRDSSDPGFLFLLKCPIFDNSTEDLRFEANSAKFYPILYEITFNNQRYICTGSNLEVGIYSGNCGSNFDFGNNDSIMTATIRPLDSCGNYCEAKTVRFSIPLYAPNIIEDE